MLALRTMNIALRITLGAVAISTVIPALLVLFADGFTPMWLVLTQLVTMSALSVALVHNQRRTPR